MSVRIDRRSLLAGAAGLASLGALGVRAAWAQDARIRLMWWGSANRNERTAKVIELFTTANPGIAIEGESAGWDDYWTRLATQTAGGNAPDVMQMDYRYIFEYARRGVLLPLDDAIAAGTLDLSGFSEEAIASG
jgi:multiple sugar transport system substrate-binding protein